MTYIIQFWGHFVLLDVYVVVFTVEGPFSSVCAGQHTNIYHMKGHACAIASGNRSPQLSARFSFASGCSRGKNVYSDGKTWPEGCYRLKCSSGEVLTAGRLSSCKSPSLPGRMHAHSHGRKSEQIKGSC